MAQQPGVPVLLVHGVLGQRHLYWNVLRRRLARDGFALEEAELPIGLLGGLDAAAARLVRHIEAVCTSTGQPRVDVVCHSAGGLVVRHALRHLGLEPRLRTVVCLGVPHHGTLLARLLVAIPVELRRACRPGSPFLRALEGVPGPASTVRFVNFWSPLDAVVVPFRNAWLPHAENVELPWVTHWGFLWQRSAHDAVARALRGERLPATAPRRPAGAASGTGPSG